MSVQALHPEATAALAERAAHVDADQDRRIETLEDMVREIRDGKTPFQQSQLQMMRLMTFQIQALAMAKLVLPSAIVVTAFFCGGAAAVFVLEHFR